MHDQKTKAGVMDGGGFDIDGGATNAVVQYCYSYNNEGAGYLVAEYAGATPLTNGTIRYNVSWKDGRRQGNNMGSLHFWNDNSNPASNCAGIKAYNNVFYTDGAVGGPAIRYQSGPMTGHSIRNNAVIVTGGAKLVDIGSNISAFTITGNSYFATDGNYAGGWAWNGATSTSLAAWRGTSGTPETVGGSPTGLQGDSLLVSPVLGAQPTAATALEAITAFRLQSSSPLINAGLNLTSSTFGSLAVGSRDFFNQPIPVGAYDIGAHEAPASIAAPAITSSLTATGTVGTAFSYTITGSNTPTSFNATGLPGGLTVNTTTGVISGTPTTAATNNVTISATNAGGTGSATLVLTVSAAANQAPTVATGATATPSPVTGTTTVFAVLGADDGGEPALTYTWGTIGTPPAAVTFSANANNAAKSSTATFTRAGNYALQVTIGDASGLTVTSSVTVTVNQTLMSIVVTPASASVVTGGTQQFSTTANDQFSQALSTQPTCTWTVTGGGTISGTGLFSATTVGGPFTVTATSGTTSGTATVTVTSLPTSTVTYNGNGNNGGTVPVDAATYLTGATVTVQGNTGTLAKAGSSFVGWNTVANGSGTAYEAAATFVMGSANVTLYAQWAVSSNDPQLLNRTGDSQGCGLGGGLALVLSLALFSMRIVNRKA